MRNSSLDFNNSFVYLLIELKPKSSKIDKNESEEFSLNAWLSIPESPTSYQYKQLLETFKSNQSYTQVQIEENFSNLITECNQKVDELKPNQYFKIAIEWILPDNLLSAPIDCWQYQRNKKIGCSPRFYSVHIRSSQRLHIKYRDCVPLWRDKWDFLWSHFQQINLSNYILACQYKSESEEDLESLCYDDDKKIIGINFPTEIQKLENITYEFIIETGIPLALWSRCKMSEVNHISDLDTLINPRNGQVLSLKNDIDLPNDLLNIFEEGYFVIEELQRLKKHKEYHTVKVQTYDGETYQVVDGRIPCQQFPIIIMTSNGEREFPLPFKRRCIQLEIKEPNPDELTSIVKAHLGDNLTEEIKTQIAKFVEKRGKGPLATDQLLNVAFMLMNKPLPDPKEKEAIIKRLMAHLNTTGEN